MKVECPNCQTTFNLPDSTVGPDGAALRCGVCKHVFHIPAPPKPAAGAPDTPPQEPTPGGKKPLDDTLAAWLEQEYDKEHPHKAADIPAAATDALAVAPESAQPVGAGASRDTPSPQEKELSVPSAGLSPAANVPVGKSAAGQSLEECPSGLSAMEWLLIAMLILAVIIGVFLGAAQVFKSWPFSEPEAQPAPQAAKAVPAKPVQPAQPAAAPQNAPARSGPPALKYAEQIKFDPFTSYLVENEKMGAPGAPARLFVIDGKLTNNSPETLSRIAVEAMLLDDKNAPVDAKTFIAGPKVSLFELKTLSKEDLESRLRSEQEIMLVNSQVKPGGSVPFMVYFVNIPNSVKNYSLKVRGYSVSEAAKPQEQPKDGEGGQSVPSAAQGQQPNAPQPTAAPQDKK